MTAREGLDVTTPKQARNGIPGPGATGGHTAQPGPDSAGDVRAAMRKAEQAANARKVETAGFIQSPAGSGVNGHQIGGGGAMFEWDAGLAINDVEGGGSG